MPALIANTVTLEEVLEVRAGPLNEEELWSVLSQSCEALHHVFIKGKARKRHFGTYTITPATILLCHTGKVKFSLDAGSPNERSYTAPETYSRRAFPSEAALEKICVYSLGMSLYHAAEFEVKVGTPISLKEPLENVLLSMCEDSAQSRSTLDEVLQECHLRYRSKNYADVVASLVEFLLGDEIPDIELEDTELDDEDFQDTSDYDMNGEVYASSISPVLASPRNLPTPPPPQITTRGQATSAELVGSNHRRVLTPPLTHRSMSPRLNSSRNLPPSLEKYKNFLEDSRSKRSMAASLNGFDQLDSKDPGSSSLQRPVKMQRMAERTSPHSHEVHIPDRYEPSPKPSYDLEPRLKVIGNDSRVGDGLRRFSSANSVTSMGSSSASGPRSSMFSDGRSSSAVSLTHGSYAPESYVTDGYDSEFYLNSVGSSVSRNKFRNGRDAPSLRDQKYISVNDLHQPPGLGSPPKIQMSSGKQFNSMPDINKDPRLPQSNKKGVSPNQPVKTFFGPEFVMITEDPDKSIVNITPNSYLKKDAQKKGGSQNRKMVTVVALNGQKLQLMAEVSMTTKDLYEHVIKFLEITEKSFFGLAKLEDDEVIFLELDVKLSKYAPPKWKEPKGEMVEFILYFRVKFYVEHLALLSHLSTRHQFYLQLRKDLLEGRLYCHEEAAFILAGLALQAETGDVDESLEQDYFLVEHYLHPRIINKVTTEYAVSQLPEYHHKFYGLSEEQAEMDFLEEAQKLPEYGIHFYKVQANKKSDAEKLYLGICVRGITVYESMGHIKSPIHKHSWPLTKKISFKKKKFFIEPRGNPDGAKLTFYTSHYKNSKYLLSMCTAFHRFQMKMRARLASIEHEVALDFAAEKQQQQQHLSVDAPPKPSPYERSPPSYSQTSLDTQRDPLPRSVSQEYKHSTENLQQYREMSVDINHNIGLNGNGVSDRNKMGKRMLSTPSIKDDIEKEKHDDVPYVIDSTLNDPRKQDLDNQQDVRDNLFQNTDTELSRTKDILKSPDRELRVIKLIKEPIKGLGITVLGGENSKRLDLGIYVKSITEGGAAAKDGRLKAGDRILAVNGKSVENVTHEQAVTLLKTTPSSVELVVSQSPHNVSALDLSSIPSAASANEEPQTLEVKPLITPPKHNAQPKQRIVDSYWSSDTQSPTDSPASTFNFPSEDEPVTLISKSISSLAVDPSTNKTTPEHPVARKEPYEEVEKIEEKLPEPVTMTTVQSVNSQPIDMTSQEDSLPPLVDSRLSSMDSHQSEISSESYSAGSVGSERSTDHEISDKSFVVELDKENGSLGLSVTGGINTTVKHGAIFVKSLILNGPADLNGNVRVGDRILEVNGISLKSVTHKQAVEIIKRAPQHCKILIDRSIHVNVPTSIKKTRPKTPEGPFVVELVKGIGGLGLSLVGGRDADPEHGGLLRIKKMFPGQPAALSNKLQVGDIVLEVNGNTLETASHQDAINMIRHQSSVVRLLIKREPSSIPAVLLNRAASDASDIDPAQLLNDIQTKLRSDIKSPPQETHKHHSRPDLELTNKSDLPDRTEIWVKQESPIPRGYGLENDRSLTHQLSDPSARNKRTTNHEPVTTSHSLPGTFAVKPQYFENVPEERKIEEKTPLHSSDIDVAKNSTRKDSDQIVSEPDLPSLLKHIRSQDSLYRTMSPRAPLAEYEESDIDEGIMINVDDGTIVQLDDDDDDVYDIDTTLTNAVPPLSDDDDDDDASRTPVPLRKIDNQPFKAVPTSAGHFSRDYDHDNQPSKVLPTLPKRLSDDANVANDDKISDDDSIIESHNSEEDIEQMLKLLEAAHHNTQEDTISSGKSVRLEEIKKDDEITVDIQESLPEQSPYSLDLSPREGKKYDFYRTKEDISKTNMNNTENEPDANSLVDDKVNNNPYLLDDKSKMTSVSAINGGILPVSHDNDDDESESDNSIDEGRGGLQEAKDKESDGNASLEVQDNEDSSRLTPKEELITVELEKGDSGGLGFTLAGGADTMGGCFVRDIIGDPAKADGRLQKGDQILQVDENDIRDMKHMQAVNVLRATKKNVKLIVLRRPTLVVSDGNSGQLESVNLTRTSRGRIGLLLTEGEEGVILVDDVVPGEPAAVEGNLKHGDRIVEIGGHKVDGIGFLAARRYLDAARPVVQLLVEKRNKAALSKYTMSSVSLEQSFSFSEDLSETVQSDEDQSDGNINVEEQKDEAMQIKLDKGPRGFGFSLVAGPSSDPSAQGIFIKTISPGSVAESDGRLRVGDQILKVNQEDVRGLSHAEVIGMLRKVTTSVTMDIQRPDTLSKPNTEKENSPSSSPSKTTNRPPNSVDLDITLEDKETLTGSSEVKDEDDIVDLLTAISSSNSQTTPTTIKEKPKLSKRDTDSVLSSLLTSIGSHSDTNNFNQADSHDSKSIADTESLPESAVNPPENTLSSTITSKSKQQPMDAPPLSRESPLLIRESPPLSGGSSPLSSPPYSRGSSQVSVDYPPLDLDNNLDKDIPVDSLQRFSSGSSDEKKLSISSNEILKSGSEESSLDSDYDDVDVFDMLQDNSETNTKKQSFKNVKKAKDNLTKIMDSYADTPPPLPTTPIPSDDEEGRPPPPPRKESLLKSSDDSWSSGPDSDFSSQPKLNGFVTLRSSGSEGKMSRFDRPLVDVISGGRYTGHKLKMLIGALQTKLNSNGPSEEFKALRGMRPTDGCEAAKHTDNREKNRYRNVLPFDATRVRLSGEGNKDYINANHIRVPVGQDTYHYIAAQGPLPNTIKDFWQMVWEQGVEVIAMVTLEQEGGKVKCNRYWPDSPDKPLLIPRFEVSLQKKNATESFVERKISLKHLESGDSIEVTHLSFTTWPDHGVPKCSVEIVQFVTCMRNLTSTQAPILVHCSAGIGRTGALITVDVSLGLIERDIMFDVDKIIRILREQRQGMIQTKDQYIFCYKACLEVLRSLAA